MPFLLEELQGFLILQAEKNITFLTLVEPVTQNC